MASNQGIELNWREKLDNEILVTPDLRGYKSNFSDPLVLNFKLMVDFSLPYGLLADESNINSALAYLKRIGETKRFLMLKKWIEVFRYFIVYYDFLIGEIEGMSEIANKKPGNMFTGEEELRINISDSTDMLCQSLLTTYRHIWFDDIRCVEVLPTNLRKFNVNILMFNSGYFNHELYDKIEGNTEIERRMYPTIKKLSEKYFVQNAKSYDFNHHLIMLTNAEINSEKSGGNYFDMISNDMHDNEIKNAIVLNYKFGNYKGVFNNIFGEFDFVSELAISAAYDRLKKRDVSLKFDNKNKKENFQNFFFNTGDIFKTIGQEEWQKLKQKPDDYLTRYAGKNTTIGKTITNLQNPNLVPKLIKNTVDLGLQMAEEVTTEKFVTKINNLVMQNFSENLIDVYKQYGTYTGIKNMNVQQSIKSDEISSPTDNPDTPSNIKNKVIVETKIYSRETF